MSSVYHAGEIEVQTRAGVRHMAQRAGNGIHDILIEGASDFLAEEPMVVVSSTDRGGHVWASLLTGEPGFARAVDERTILLRATSAPGDPLAEIVSCGIDHPSTRFELGLLVIDLETRERMRINGPAEMQAENAILVHAREVYFNCPKYIQKREVALARSTESAEPGSVRDSSLLSPEQRTWIGMADTFFVGSSGPDGHGDASHRGGNPGFVQVRDAATLEWPDYSGNTMFNTLGNITANPSAGLLFLDFEKGSTLQLTGQAKVVWEPKRAAQFPGAERIVEFSVKKVVEATRVLPLHFQLLQYSRFNPGDRAKLP